MRVFITGGTGLVGTRLIRRLIERHDEVVLLTRRPAVARNTFGDKCTIVEGDPVQHGPWMDAVRSSEGAINLAGEGIFNHRWSAGFKAILRDSRVKTTQNLVEALAKSPTTPAGAPKVLVNASAIGYYGFHADEIIAEDGQPGSDFLATVCVDWEKAARAAEAVGVRVVLARIGVVLDRKGGALAKMLTPFKIGVGGPIGSGKQWMSWVHGEDVVGMLLFALDNPSVTGPMNVTAPQPVTNRDFGKALGRALHRPSFLPTPGFALRIGLGEVADIITQGQKVIPQKAASLEYPFRFSEIHSALANIFG